jgi:hypothetical protein
MVQELTELRQKIIEGQISEALALIDEMDGMSKKAIIRAMRSYLIRMLVHLIKNQVEKRLTNSWATSIRSSVREIQDLNLQENKTSFYIRPEDWPAQLESSWETALEMASEEIFGGKYPPQEIESMVDQTEISKFALILLHSTFTIPRKELSSFVNEHLRALPGGETWAL